MSQSFEFEDVDRAVIGAIGEPGHRVFLMQVVNGSEKVTLKAEKQQMAALVGYLVDALEGLGRPGHLPEDLDLVGPFDIAWIIDSIGVEWSDELNRFIIEMDEQPLSQDQPGARGQFMLTREQAAALSIKTTSVLEAGRPPCPLCGYPLDPQGHACPKTNGNRPPKM